MVHREKDITMLTSLRSLTTTTKLAIQHQTVENMKTGVRENSCKQYKHHLNTSNTLNLKGAEPESGTFLLASVVDMVFHMS